MIALLLVFDKKLREKQSQKMDIDDRIEEIQNEIDRIEEMERKLELELKDVLTDINTPDNSEDEEEEDEYQEDDWIVAILKDRLLNASGTPTRICEFLELYQNPEYRRNVQRKMVRMKNSVRSTRVSVILRNPNFLCHLRRIQNTYPDDGGRQFLNELVALHCTLNQE